MILENLNTEGSGSLLILEWIWGTEDLNQRYQQLHYGHRQAVVRLERHSHGPDEKLALRILHFSGLDVITQGHTSALLRSPLESNEIKKPNFAIY